MKRKKQSSNPMAKYWDGCKHPTSQLEVWTPNDGGQTPDGDGDDTLPGPWVTWVNTAPKGQPANLRSFRTLKICTVCNTTWTPEQEKARTRATRSELLELALSGHKVTR